VKEQLFTIKKQKEIAEEIDEDVSLSNWKE
jgi:hypothetical protein